MMRGGDEVTKIEIKGVIVPNDDKWIYDWFELDSTSPDDVKKVIEQANGDELEVIINSAGGDVFAGSEIYTMLKDYRGEVNVKIVGVAASAASVVAMAGKKVMMSPTAEIMIHNVTAITNGDYREMEHSSEVLKDYNSTIANAYMLKTGLEKEELLAMMDEETWLTPEKALEYGFIDEIMFTEEKLRLVASLGNVMLPEKVLNKIRNMRVEQRSVEMQRAKLNLLKLKGAIKSE